MAKGQLIPMKNVGHKVLAPGAREPSTGLRAFAERYFRIQVAGQAEGTQDAKRRDLACFLQFYVQLYGHDDSREWYKSVTEAFVKELARGTVPRPSKTGEPQPRRLSPSISTSHAEAPIAVSGFKLVIRMRRAEFAM